MVNKGRQSSQGRFDYFNRIWDMMKESNAPVIIEGKRDTIALRNLGYEGDLVELNDGKSILSTVENLVHKYGRGSNFIILMDWDRTGEKLAAKLKNYGDSCDCLLYTSPSPRDLSTSRMPSSA